MSVVFPKLLKGGSHLIAPGIVVPPGMRIRNPALLKPTLFARQLKEILQVWSTTPGGAARDTLGERVAVMWLQYQYFRRVAAFAYGRNKRRTARQTKSFTRFSCCAPNGALVSLKLSPLATLKDVKRAVAAKSAARCPRAARDPRYVVLTYVLVGWALNMLGFLVFWIPTEGSGIDRSGLAMTTILTAQFMMYEAKVTQVTTWLDMYFSQMIAYQLVAFLLTVHSARRNRMVLALGGDGDYLDKVYRRQYELGEGSGGHFKNVVFFLFNLLFGGRDAFPVDRWARRYFVPFFTVTVTTAPVLPSSSPSMTWAESKRLPSPVTCSTVARSPLLVELMRVFTSPAPPRLPSCCS